MLQSLAKSNTNHPASVLVFQPDRALSYSCRCPRQFFALSWFPWLRDPLRPWHGEFTFQLGVRSISGRGKMLIIKNTIVTGTVHSLAGHVYDEPSFFASSWTLSKSFSHKVKMSFSKSVEKHVIQFRQFGCVTANTGFNRNWITMVSLPVFQPIPPSWSVFVTGLIFCTTTLSNQQTLCGNEVSKLHRQRFFRTYRFFSNSSRTIFNLWMWHSQPTLFLGDGSTEHRKGRPKCNCIFKNYVIICSFPIHSENWAKSLQPSKPVFFRLKRKKKQIFSFRRKKMVRLENMFDKISGFLEKSSNSKRKKRFWNIKYGNSEFVGVEKIVSPKQIR